MNLVALRRTRTHARTHAHTHARAPKTQNGGVAVIVVAGMIAAVGFHTGWCLVVLLVWFLVKGGAARASLA